MLQEKMRPIKWIFVVTILLFIVELGSAQQQEFVSFYPAKKEQSIKEPAGVAQNSKGELYIADPASSSVYHIGLNGAILQRIQKIKIDGSLVSLRKPVDVAMSLTGFLYILDLKENKYYVYNPIDSTATRHGIKGGNLGQLDEPTSIAVDPAGYVYIANPENESIVVHSPNGEALTWINGPTNNRFKNATAVAVSPSGDIYVLDKEGPSVYVFDSFLNMTMQFTNLAAKPSVDIKNATDIAVLGNGDFFIVDEKQAKISQFNTKGSLVRTIGIKGRHGKGTFENARSIDGSLLKTDRLFITDDKYGSVQEFKVPFDKVDKAFNDNRISVIPKAPELAAMSSLATSYEGLRYMSSQNFTSRVIAYDQDLKTVSTLAVRKVGGVATDLNGNVFVLDSDGEEVVFFDKTGVLIRKFGREIGEKLSNPSDIAVFSDGSIAVVDYGNKKIKKWNSQGVFQGDIVKISPTIERPYLIDVTPNDILYVFDRDKNYILQFDQTGKQLNYFKLQVRSSNPQKMGEITDFFVDVIGQIHLYNNSTYQYEIWNWSENSPPQQIFSMGSRGSGPTQFDDVTNLLFDPSTLLTYVSYDKSRKVKAFEVALRPPPITTNFSNEVNETNYTVNASPVISLLVKGYRLKATFQGQDSVIAQSNQLPLEVPPFYSETNKEMRKMKFFTYGTTSESKDPIVFSDYFGYANYLFSTSQQVEAFDYYKNGLKTITDSPTNRLHIAQKYASLGKKLAERYELTTGMIFLNFAYELSPTDTDILVSLGFGYAKLFEMLRAENKYDEILKQATKILTIEDAALRSNVVESLISISAELKKAETTELLQQAVKMYAKLQELLPNRLEVKVGFAESSYALYKAKKRGGAPSFELAVQLAESEKVARIAKEAQSPGSELYHTSNLLLLEILMNASKFEPIIASCVEELQQAGISMSEATEINYRLVLADAYLQNTQTDLAVLEYQRVLTKNPKDETYLRLYANAQVLNLQFDEAISIYRTLLLNNREDARLIGEIGKVELKKGNFNEASFQIEKAIKTNPTLINLYGPLAESFDGASQYQKAIENYKIAIRSKKEEYDQARNQMVSSTVVNVIQNQLIQYETNLARIYLQTGNYEEGILSYQSILQFNQANAVAWKGLGEALLSAGQVYEAINAFNTALKLNPTSDAISSALSNARNLRDEMSKNRPPVEIIKADIKEVYPSLYKNYSDATVLPIGFVVLANNTRLPYNNIEMTFFIKDLMASPTPQQMKNLQGYSNTTIALSAVFTDAILKNAESKSYNGVITLKFTHEGKEKIVEKNTTFTIQSRNAIQWSDKRRLASFIEPASGPLVDFVKSIDVLFSKAPTYGLNKNILKASAIFTTFTNNTFVYSPDPESGYQAASTKTEILDFMQYPAETILRKSGDCDDFVALLCGTLEASGIATAYIDVPGHVFMAFDSGIEVSELQAAGLDPSQVIVQYNKVWIPVESTLLGTQNFKTAWIEASRRYYQEQKDGNFPELVPLADARSVYKPVSYVPEIFKPVLPAEDVLIAAQTEFVQYMLGVTVARQLAALEQRFQTEPRNLYVRNKLAILYAQTGDLTKAETLFKESVDLAPENPMMYNNLGNILFLKTDFPGAFAAYVKSLELDNTDAEVYINLCKTQLAMGDKANASRSFDKATSMQPPLKDLYDYLKLELN